MKTVIVGGGPVGLATALALKHAEITDDVTVLEAAPHATELFSDRNIALSAASWKFLSRIGVAIPDAATAAICAVEVTQMGVFGLLRLEASDIDSPNLGAAAPYPRLKAGFDDAVKRAGINVVYGARVVAVHHVARHAEAHLVTGEQLRADCLVLADGAGSDLVAGFKRFERDSGQTAVIARAAPHKPRTGVAFERFTPGGALALVPRADGEWTVIWARPKHEADRLRSDESGTAAEINAAFGSAMGHLTLTSKISSYPLNWRFVEPRVSGAIAAMGNAAQGLHPAAAQGLNLGFRDVRDFVSVLVRNRERAHAVPVAAVLNEFARARSADRIMSIGFTGLLAHGFDRGGWLAGLPRGLSLTALQLATPLRRELTRRFALN